MHPTETSPANVPCIFFAAAFIHCFFLKLFMHKIFEKCQSLSPGPYMHVYYVLKTLNYYVYSTMVPATFMRSIQRLYLSPAI